jgi:mannose-6-phosphate isomerase-like protein (cupin superfamily)
MPITSKNIDKPDETREFDKGKVDFVTIGEIEFGRATFQPGWKWSECVKPIAGTESCEFTHNTYVVSGRLHVVMNDGTATDLGPGDIGIIPAGHDAWVVGSEPVVAFDFASGSTDYAKR